MINEKSEDLKKLGNPFYRKKTPNDDGSVALFTLHHFSSSLGLSVIFGARNLQRDIGLPRLIIYNHHLSEEVGFYLS